MHLSTRKFLQPNTDWSVLYHISRPVSSSFGSIQVHMNEWARHSTGWRHILGFPVLAIVLWSNAGGIRSSRFNMWYKIVYGIYANIIYDIIFFMYARYYNGGEALTGGMSL